MVENPTSTLSECQLLEQLSAGTVLAFDFGKRRIGVAMGNTTLGIAHPLITIDSEVTERRFAMIAELIET